MSQVISSLRTLQAITHTTMYTTASLIFKTLADAGVTHAFVNWGNDHPAFLEELERERVEDGKTVVEIITCPHEMVALSAAQGYAQVTGKPAAVIVHVDCGTQVSIPPSIYSLMQIGGTSGIARCWLSPCSRQLLRN